ncbi:hypothetical protein QYE76_025654 [Lolium multiflorum]|uniref:Peptidase A1 domain-containing protein n=1 Tax=Lolium multiflorum TaxID=4521 RepID=A0AAD8RFN3_LOLMU|nr:hypothetical protein QYE76_025654 [Lolium multiflorum]
MAASLLVLLLPLAPAPVSSAAIPQYANIDEFVVKEVRTIIKNSAKDYLKQIKAHQGVMDLSHPIHDGQLLGSQAAESFGAFVFDLFVGTSAALPPQTLSVVMDITTGLVWTQCEPCTSCTTVTPGTSIFLPYYSDSFAEVGCDTETCQSMIPAVHLCAEDGDLCDYSEDFHGAGNTSGYLATDSFSFGTTAVPGVLFGCSVNTMLPNLGGAAGFASFSRGPLSLVSQLNISSFTYSIALPDDPADKSFLSWSRGTTATAAMLTKERSSSSTPLLAPTIQQNIGLYYVNLTGVQVDGKLLTDIPVGTFDVRANGSGGVFLSTTLPVTYLEEVAYRVLRQELVNRVQSQGVAPVNLTGGGVDLDHLCFLRQNFDSVKIPTIALVFDGADAAMELQVQNYFFDDEGGQTCLTILPSIGRSVLGNLLQAGKTMTYDIHDDGGGLLTFKAAVSGGTPGPERVSLVIIIATLLAWVLGLQSHF